MSACIGKQFGRFAEHVERTQHDVATATADIGMRGRLSRGRLCASCALHSAARRAFRPMRRRHAPFDRSQSSAASRDGPLARSPGDNSPRRSARFNRSWPRPQNTLVFLDGRYVDAKVAANRLIAGFPPEARSSLRTRVRGPRAARIRTGASGRPDRSGPRRCGRLPAHRGGPASTGRGRRTLPRRRAIHRSGRLRARIAGNTGDAAGVGRRRSPGDGVAQAGPGRCGAAMGRERGETSCRVTKSKSRGQSSHSIGGSWSASASQPAATRGGRAVVAGGHPQTVVPGHFERPSTRAIWNKRLEAPASRRRWHRN